MNEMEIEGVSRTAAGGDSFRHKFLCAKSFILKILEHTKPSRPWNRDQQGEFSGNRDPDDIWNLLTPELQKDREIALTAFVSEHAHMKDLVAPWNEDRVFFLEAAGKKLALWYRIPLRFQSDPAFVQELLGTSFEFCNDEMVADVLQKCPELSEDRFIWEGIVSSWDPNVETKNLKSKRRRKSYFDRLFSFRSSISTSCSLLHAPQSIRSDRVLMTRACSWAPKELGNVDHSLLADESFLELVLTKNPMGLLFLPQEVRINNVDLVITHLPAFLRSEIGMEYAKDLVEGLGKAFVQEANLEFAKAWFPNGGAFLKTLFPASWMRERSIWLWIAQYHSSGTEGFEMDTVSYQEEVFRIEEDPFDHMSVELKGDLAFMMQITELHPGPFESYGDTKQDKFFEKKPKGCDYRENFHVAVRALSHCQHFTRRYVNPRRDQSPYGDNPRRWWSQRHEFVEKFKRWLADRIQCHKVFVELILPQMSSIGSSASLMRILDQGQETTIVYKKLIAAYLDVPIGKEWKFCTATMANLKNAGY